MAYENLVKTKKGQTVCEKLPYFCGACVECLSFLIEENGFEKAIIEANGREYQVKFKKSNLVIGLSYEMGSLPSVFILFNDKIIDLSEIDSNFLEKNFLHKYKIHSTIRNMLNESYSNVNGYIGTMGKIWNDNKQKIISEIRDHVFFMSVLIKNNLNKILSLMDK